MVDNDHGADYRQTEPQPADSQPRQQRQYTPQPPEVDIGRWLTRIEYMLKQTGLDKDVFIQDQLIAIIQSTNPVFRRSLMQSLEDEMQMAMIEGDPFLPHPDEETLKVPGILVGTHNPTGFDFYWGYDEQPQSVMILGAPGQGKTNLAFWLLERLSQDRKGPKACFWAWCLRFDYAGLAALLPHTRGLWLSKSKWNAVKPPTGVPAQTRFSAFAGKISDHLNLQIAGREFLSRHLMELYTTEFKKGNHWPAVKDLIIYFEQLVCDSRDEKGYKARVLEKLRAFDAVLGFTLDCEAGIDFERLLDDCWNVIFVMADLDKNICDLVTTLTMDYVYYYRMFNDDKPRGRLFLILDEQRHLIRERK